MSFLTKSIEKRIQELHALIEAQKAELAAFEQVLALESGKPPESVVTTPPIAVKAAHKPAPTARSATQVTVPLKGTRTDFVADILKERGSAGVTPAEISAAFAARKIQTSKNLVYNVLSVMYKQKRVRKSGGKYFPAGVKLTGPPVAASAGAAPKKRRISEEGMRRIIAATKKRWALVRAAKPAGKPTGKAAGKPKVKRKAK